MKKIYLVIGAVFTVGVLVTAVSLLLTGPHMDEQPDFKTFDAVPRPPAFGAVSLEGAPAAGAGGAARPAGPEALQRGRTDYHYYCVFCHGERGKGDGPVGESYVPRPADLSVVSWGDAGLPDMAARMLTGPGHSPVLERVVPPSEVPYLAVYVRTLSSSK